MSKRPFADSRVCQITTVIKRILFSMNYGSMRIGPDVLWFVLGTLTQLLAVNETGVDSLSVHHRSPYAVHGTADWDLTIIFVIIYMKI